MKGRGKFLPLLLKILALITSTGFVAGITIFIVVMGDLTSTRTSRFPAFARDLPRNFREADAAFARSIAAQFPAGAAETALTDYLKKEGFKPTWEEGRQAAEFSKSLFPCVHLWRVSWKRNTETPPHLSEAAKGQYQPACL